MNINDQNNNLYVFNRFIELELIRDIKNKKGQVVSKEMIKFNTDNAYFTVNAKKFLSHMKDEALIDIFNIDQKKYLEIKNKGYKYINIYAGYHNQNQEKRFLVMTNQILLITYDRSDLNTSKMKILCSSRYRKRENITPITFKQGQSIWGTLNILCKRKGIRALIDNRLKNKILQNNLVVYDENDAIDQILRDYDFVSISNDLRDKQYDLYFVMLYNRERKSIIISPETGTLIKDWISIDGDNAISFTSLPIINYYIGDSIRFQSKWFNQVVTSTNDYKEYIKKSNVLNRFQNEIENNKDNILLFLNDDEINQIMNDMNITRNEFNNLYKNNDKKLREKIIEIKRNNQNNSYVFDDQNRWNEYTIVQLEYNLELKGDFQVKILAKPESAFKRKIKRI